MTTPTIALCAISAAISAAGAYQWQAYRYEARMAAMVAEYAQAQHTAIEVAHAETIRLQERKGKAEVQAARRVRAAAADAAVLRGALDRLSDAADSALRESSDSIATCTAHGATVTELFGQCASRYGDVAKEADGWRNEAMTLREAWPAQ